MKLKPLPGYALVKIEEKYSSGLSSERQKYEQRSCGTLISFKSGEDTPVTSIYQYDTAVDKTVYFEPFNDGEPVRLDSEEYVFLPLNQLRGVKDA